MKAFRCRGCGLTVSHLGEYPRCPSCLSTRFLPVELAAPAANKIQWRCTGRDAEGRACTFVGASAGALNLHARGHQRAIKVALKEIQAHRQRQRTAEGAYYRAFITAGREEPKTAKALDDAAQALDGAYERYFKMREHGEAKPAAITKPAAPAVVKKSPPPPKKPPPPPPKKKR